MRIFCEKPLGISVEEVRVIRATYLENRGKLATQHGTQRHALEVGGHQGQVSMQRLRASQRG